MATKKKAATKAAKKEAQEPKQRKSKRKTEEEIRADYPDVVEGSVQFVPKDVAEDHVLAKWAGKQVCQRPCERSGKLFWLATSDLHQTRFHPDVRADVRKERAMAKRAEKAAKKAEEEAA